MMAQVRRAHKTQAGRVFWDVFPWIQELGCCSKIPQNQQSKFWQQSYPAWKCPKTKPRCPKVKSAAGKKIGSWKLKGKLPDDGTGQV